MPVAIYARKSEESEDRQVQSLDDQINALKALATREGILEPEVFQEAKSAKMPFNRPEFDRLTKAVQEGRITGILTWSINRLSRNSLDGGHVAHLLETGKLEFIRTPERTYHPDDSALILAIENGMAVAFIQDLRRGVNRGLEGKASRGWLPGRAPLGYLNDPIAKVIVPDPLRFALIKRGWELIASKGYTLAQVQRELIAEGLTGRSGKPVGTSLLYALFRRPFYTGKFMFHGVLRDGKHPPMVTQELFDRVQIALGNAPKVKEHHVQHPYAGVFTCPACGCQITAETRIKTYKTTGVSRSYTYYRCTGYKGCSKASVTSYQLDMVIDRLYEALRVPKEYLEWAHRQIAIHAEHGAKESTEAEERLKSQAHRIRTRLRTLQDMRLDGEIDGAEFMSEKGRLGTELASLESQLEKRRTLANRVDNSIASKLDSLEELQGYDSMSASAKRALIRSIARKCFLTLEKAVFGIDEVIYKIATFEPARTSFRSDDHGDLAVSVSCWSGLLKNIRTLEECQILEGSGSTVCITVSVASGTLKAIP